MANRLQMCLEIESCWKRVSCSLISEEYFLHGSLFGQHSNKPNLSFKQINVYLGQVAWLCVTLESLFPWRYPPAIWKPFPDLDFDWKLLCVFLQNRTFLCIRIASLLKERWSVFGTKSKECSFLFDNTAIRPTDGYNQRLK